MELESQFEILRQMKRKVQFALIFLAVAVLLTFALANVVGIVAGIVGAVVIIGDVIFLSSANKKYAQYFKENVVEKILESCDFLTDIHFSPENGISEELIESTGMIRTGNRFNSNDLITGKVNGVDFTQSDVTIEEETTDSEGHTSTTTIFKGRWLIFDFNKEFKANLQVRSKRFYSAKRRGGLFSFGKPKSVEIKFENEEFNKNFKVYAESEHEAFYIITPHIMESILGLQKKMNCPIMLMFIGGILHIAVYNNKDAFEPKIFGKLDPQKESERIVSDIKLITDFATDMNLDRDIYKN